MEVEGITEEELGIGGPGRWGSAGSDAGDDDEDGGKKGSWWRGLLGKKKRSPAAAGGKKGFKWRNLGCFK